MATKDLIKKIKSSNDIKPDQLKYTQQKDQEMSEVLPITLEETQTAEDRIKEEIETIEKLEDLPDRKYLEDKFDKLKIKIEELTEQSEILKTNLELLLETNIKLRQFLVQQEKSKSKRLFKWL